MGDNRPAHLDSTIADDSANDDSSAGHTPRQDGGRGRRPTLVTARTGLLERRHWDYEAAHPGPCNHGTFSPRPMAHPSYGSNAAMDNSSGTLGGFFDGAVPERRNTTLRRLLGDSVVDQMTRTHSSNETATTTTTSKTAAAAARLGKDRQRPQRRIAYLSYYVPFFGWIRQYRWSWLRGDVVAAFTMASFYLPMALSLAENLSHVPAINGLYSYVVSPLVYAFLGSSSRMVVGPEAAGSLLLGTIVRSNIDSGQFSDDDDINHARTAGVVTGLAGSFILIAGLTRLGFLDNVLSRPFLRGFISAIGFVILVDQLIPELGLSHRATEVGGGVKHGSSVSKIAFLVQEIRCTHKLTAIVSASAFGVIMLCRAIKGRLQPRFPGIAYIPDRFVVVVLSAVLTRRFRWDRQGLLILGDVRSNSGGPLPFHWPFQRSHMDFIQQSLSTSFLIGMLGFFESSVAAKALGGGGGNDGRRDAGPGVTLSANRELVALGLANLVGGCFMALPAFGGYGRSKVNISTGGKTPMSSILLSLITILCVLYGLPYFHYLPKAVLSSMISVVAWSLIEEAPHDIGFFYRLGGWSELLLMFLIFTATIFYSLALGIAIGVGLSLVMVIRHSTMSRIQILGRVPGTRDFENAEAARLDELEFIEGCLIVKIPEPLTFANTGDLKNRLRRLEQHGSTAAHPALPPSSSSSSRRHRRQHDHNHHHDGYAPPEHNQNIIFDVHGVTSIDGSGAQELAGIVAGYRERGVRVFFCRVPPERSPVFRRFVGSGIVDMCGGMRHFVSSVDQALRMSEVESFTSDSLQAGGV